MFRFIQTSDTALPYAYVKFIPSLLVVLVFIVGCSPEIEPGTGIENSQMATMVASTTPVSQLTPSDLINTEHNDETEETPAVTQVENTLIPPSTPTPIPTSTVTPIPTSTPTETPNPSPTMAGQCTERIPSDDLLTLVSSTYPISAEYVPGDLASLSDYLPREVTLGYETELRSVVIPRLVMMVEDMRDEGLSPQIISGYRSYAAQMIAWQKWLENEPERASLISVPPGQSEHQLGTTVDFGSPELAQIVGDDEIEFHTYFYKTGEGAWLQEHAHEYGFTLSYPLEAFEVTGFYYEPWHYRYVGLELAAYLIDNNISLTQYLLEMYSPPCYP